MRARCRPKVDHGEAVVDGWEPRAARCLPFHAEGAEGVVTGASDRSLFLFSEDRVSGKSFLRLSPSERRPERLRVRGGLRAPGGVEAASSESRRAGRSSTMCRSTRRGSDREGEKTGGSEGETTGGESGCDISTLLGWLSVRIRSLESIDGMSTSVKLVSKYHTAHCAGQLEHASNTHQ